MNNVTLVSAFMSNITSNECLKVNDNYTLNQRDAVGLWDLENIEMSAIQQSEVLLMEVPMNF